MEDEDFKPDPGAAEDDEDDPYVPGADADEDEEMPEAEEAEKRCLAKIQHRIVVGLSAESGKGSAETPQLTSA